MANWMKKAVSHKGAFRKQAKRAHMSTAKYATKVTRKGSRASTTTKRRATLAKTFARFRKH